MRRTQPGSTSRARCPAEHERRFGVGTPEPCRRAGTTYPTTASKGAISGAMPRSSSPRREQRVEVVKMEPFLVERPAEPTVGNPTDGEETGQLDRAVLVFLGARPRLFGIAYRVLRNPFEAEDVVQDAWMRWQATDRAAVLNAEA